MSRQERLTLVATILGSTVVFLDATVVNVALPAIGPAGGGALIGLLSWRAIFWINLPLVAITAYIALRAVRETRDPDAPRGIDWLGIALSAAGLGGPVFALIEQPTHGWGDPLVWVPLVAGVACFALFLLHEARARQPMLHLSLFRIRNFAVANVTTLAAYAGLIGGLFFVTLFLQQIVDYTAGRLRPRLPHRRLPRGARLRTRPLGHRGAAHRNRARLGLRAPRRDRLRGQQRRLPAAVSASTSAFHLGALIAGLLMIVGGSASAIGIQDPRRARSPVGFPA